MIIIDAYNFIGCNPHFSLGAKRKEDNLLSWFKQNATPESKITLVFDSTTNDPATHVNRSCGSIKVIYSDPGESADERIIMMIQKNPNPRLVTVVSNDREIIIVAKHRRCKIINCQDFYKMCSRQNIKTSGESKKEYKMTAGEIEKWEKLFNTSHQ